MLAAGEYLEAWQLPRLAGTSPRDILCLMAKLMEMVEWRIDSIFCLNVSSFPAHSFSKLEFSSFGVYGPNKESYEIYIKSTNNVVSTKSGRVETFNIRQLG